MTQHTIELVTGQTCFLTGELQYYEKHRHNATGEEKRKLYSILVDSQILFT